MKKWLRRIGLALLILLVAAVVAGAAYEWSGRRAARRDHPPRGVTVDVGGRHLQLDCRGAGAPVVVLESGLDLSGSLSWGLVHDSLAATSRTCAYSRAGILWSEPRPQPFSGSAVAEDLRAALAAARESGPYVMVGHSLGGPLILTFTGRYPDDVAGLVMVDASHPDQLERLREFLPGGAMPAMTPLRIASALSWSGLVRLMGRGQVAQPSQPEADQRAMLSHMSTSLGGMLQELDGLERVLNEAKDHRQLADRPVVVLTAMKPPTAEERAPMRLSEERAAAMKEVWRALHEDQASWSSRSRHQLVDDASHYIQFDRPDVVIAAVREVVGAVRRDAP